MKPASLKHLLWRPQRWPVSGLLCAMLFASVLAHAHDYPTIDRVLYVQECMHAHPGPGFEMTSKCVCVLDALAEQMGHGDFVAMTTVSKATTIAGERGGAIRDAPALAEQLKRFRALQGQAEKACFISAASR